MFNKEENSFKLPIAYLKTNNKVTKNLIDDLELTKTIDPNNKPIYNYVFLPKTELGKECIPKWSQYYTTNRQFLKESQDLYKKINNMPFDKYIIEKMLVSWREIRKQTNFTEKYQYIEWEKLKWLNYSSPFLSVLSFYNISAPVLQLTAPFFILLIPFVLLKVMNLPITWATYYKILLDNLKHHAIGKLLLSFNSVSLGQKMYILFAIGMYLYNIYQNIISCYRFYKNTYYIISQFETINTYLDYTIEQMKFFEDRISRYKTYKSFNNNLINYKNKLQIFKNAICSIPTNKQNIKKITYIGSIMKHFFALFDSDELEDIFNFSFDFNGYIDTILGINTNIKNKKINICKFTNKMNFKLKKMYYPVIENPVKNDICMKKNIVITGPNAAGKTTTIKATIINLLLTQQIGYGYFDIGKSGTFDFIHCYLNIPDSCSRDSLFQAEARRCKNILTCIDNNPNKRHFCIFDELYSGTNPYEAISSAYSYLDYISQNKNVRFLLTTHYIRLCNLLKPKSHIKNQSMKTGTKNGTPIYTYRIIDGISTVKGGVSVLKELDYPTNLINLTTTILEKL